MSDEPTIRNPDDRDGALDPRLASELDALPLEIAPPHDLYPEVRSRIRRNRRSQGTRRALALAAGVALAVAAAALLRPGRPEAAPVPAPPTTVVGIASSGITPANVVGHTAFSEPDLALAAIREQLRREIDAKQDRLPPATRALVFENLATIDRAIAEIQIALAEEPSNPALGRTYIAYREREIDLLRQANRAVARL